VTPDAQPVADVDAQADALVVALAAAGFAVDDGDGAVVGP
jgi:hypothetical protein